MAREVPNNNNKKGSNNNNQAHRTRSRILSRSQRANEILLRMILRHRTHGSTPESYPYFKLACDAFQKHQHLQGLFRRQMRSMADPKQISCSSRCHGIYQESKVECGLCKKKNMWREEFLQLNCNHIFHKNCFLNWFIKNENCPICLIKITAIKDSQGENNNDGKSPPGGHSVAVA